MNKGYFLLGIGGGLIVLAFYANMIIQSNKVKSQTWKPLYEQVCVEDGNSPKDCLCAVTYIDQSSPSAELNGEILYTETKGLLKGVCL